MKTLNKWADALRHHFTTVNLDIKYDSSEQIVEAIRDEMRKEFIRIVIDYETIPSIGRTYNVVGGVAIWSVELRQVIDKIGKE